MCGLFGLDAVENPMDEGADEESDDDGDDPEQDGGEAGSEFAEAAFVVSVHGGVEFPAQFSVFAETMADDVADGFGGGGLAEDAAHKGAGETFVAVDFALQPLNPSSKRG